MKEYCGLFGISGHKTAANLVYLGLYALQHRGQESAGICATDGVKLRLQAGMGLVADVFDKERLLRLPGSRAIGHNRYSTTGGSHRVNMQPLLVDIKGRLLSLAHNGNLVNARELRQQLKAKGAIFSSTNDSEVILHLMARSRRGGLEEQLQEALKRVKGAYSLLLMDGDKMIAVRDPYGFRPLCYGRLGRAHVFASESCAFDLIGARYVRELERGEMLVVNGGRLRSRRMPVPRRGASCIFEFIYFSRPDSFVFGHDVHDVRQRLGCELFREHPVDADLVMPVPDSSNVAAIGYAEQAKLPFKLGLIRSHYIGRTFIEPDQSIRDFGTRIKYNPVKGLVKGKRLVVVDDSIVRGTTTRKLVAMLRQAGAKQVHVRITAPVITHSCFYGIDTPTRKELIGSSYSVARICKHLGADSLGYLSISGLRRAAEDTGLDFCTACFDGKYPVGKGE